MPKQPSLAMLVLIPVYVEDGDVRYFCQENKSSVDFRSIGSCSCILLFKMDKNEV
jgi:hypothetical protein